MQQTRLNSTPPGAPLIPGGCRSGAAIDAIAWVRATWPTARNAGGVAGEFAAPESTWMTSASEASAIRSVIQHPHQQVPDPGTLDFNRHVR